MRSLAPLLIFTGAMTLGHAQSPLYHYTEDRLLVRDFDPMADDKGNVAVAYTSEQGSSPRIYRMNFLVFGPQGSRKHVLPVKTKVYGAGYTDTTFFFLLQSSSRQPLEIMEMNKDGDGILRNYQLIYENEQVLSAFTDLGTFYFLTLIKKSNEIRIRVIRGAREPIMLTYKISKELFQRMEDNTFKFVHNRFEQALADVVGSKIFFNEDKLWLGVGRYEKDLKESKKVMRFLELSFKTEAPGLVLREIPVKHNEQLSVFPLRDNLFLFHSEEENFYLGVASISSLQVVKYFSLKDTSVALIQSRLYKQEGTGLPDGTIKQPKSSGAMVRKLSVNYPFIYARDLGDRYKICFGSYEYPTSVSTESTSGGTITNSTPYGNVTSSTPGMNRVRVTTSSTANLAFVYGYLDKNLNVVGSDRPEETIFETLAKFTSKDDFNQQIDEHRFCQSSSGTYLVGFSKKNDQLTVWSWSRK